VSSSNENNLRGGRKAQFYEDSPPFIRAIEKHNAGSREQVEHVLVHTGQHYDHQMSQTFFGAMNIPPADIHLGVG